MTKPLVIVVAAALMNADHKILFAERPQGKSMAGLWEFPGGKVEAGETPEQALVREMFEELNIVIDPKDLEPLTFASHEYDTFHMLMPLYVCKTWKGELFGREGQCFEWAEMSNLKNYPMPPADLPLIERIVDFLSRIF